MSKGQFRLHQRVSIKFSYFTLSDVTSSSKLKFNSNSFLVILVRLRKALLPLSGLLYNES